jgi:hypothetical protein
VPAPVAHDLERSNAVLAHVRQVHGFELVFEEPAVRGSPLRFPRPDHRRAVRVLDLDPVPRRARSIGCTQPLRDDAPRPILQACWKIRPPATGASQRGCGTLFSVQEVPTRSLTPEALQILGQTRKSLCELFVHKGRDIAPARARQFGVSLRLFPIALCSLRPAFHFQIPLLASTDF